MPHRNGPHLVRIGVQGMAVYLALQALIVILSSPARLSSPAFAASREAAAWAGTDPRWLMGGTWLLAAALIAGEGTRVIGLWIASWAWITFAVGLAVSVARSPVTAWIGVTTYAMVGVFCAALAVLEHSRRRALV